jgi:hypothetical protein
MRGAILAVPIVLHLIAAAGDNVPLLDVLPSCLAAAGAQVIPTNRMQSCIESEQRAHDTRVKQWISFTSADRAKCVGFMMEFEPAYSELHSCLEISNDAGKLPAELY